MSGLCWLTQWIDFLQNKRFFVPNDSVYILSLEFALDCTRTWNHYKQLSHLKPVSHRRIKTLNRSSSYLQRINSLPFVVEIVHKMHFVEKTPSRSSKEDSVKVRRQEMPRYDVAAQLSGAMSN